MSRRCVFLDRDGVINVSPPAGEYIRSWREFQLIEPVVDWIRLFNALDFLVIVITNQRGVARGLLGTEELDAIHLHMMAELTRRGGRIDDVFACIHEEQSCECRKPRPGLVIQAARKWDIDLSQSLVIGDSDSDRALAGNCGMKFARVSEGRIVEIAGNEGQEP